MHFRLPPRSHNNCSFAALVDIKEDSVAAHSWTLTDYIKKIILQKALSRMAGQPLLFTIIILVMYQRVAAEKMPLTCDELGRLCQVIYIQNFSS